MVLIPVYADTNRPIVDPQGESFLTINSYKGMFLDSANNLTMEADIRSVA